ncbi:MAG: hypothetical protein V1750_02715 [Acidobacteriota bacterium]
MGEILRLLYTAGFPVECQDEAVRDEAWQMALVVRLAQVTGKVEAITGRVIPGPGGVRFVSESGEAVRDLPRAVESLEKQGLSWRVAAVTTLAGSSATLWLVEGGIVAVAIEPLTTADERSPDSWWVRDLTFGEISARTGSTNCWKLDASPGSEGRGGVYHLSCADRSSTGGARLVATDLNLPSAFFMSLPHEVSGKPGVRLIGRGTGLRREGLCLRGAYKLALGGASYREILNTYYAGVEIGAYARATQ